MFIAAVIVWCASGLSEPSDIALATKRLHRLDGLSTSSSASSGPAGRISSRSRSTAGSRAITSRVKIANAPAGSVGCGTLRALPTTDCSAFTVGGCQACGSATSALRKRTQP